MKRRFGAVVLSLCLSCSVVGIAPVVWAGGETGSGVVFTDGMLSVSVDQMALGSLLGEIAAKAKITVHVADEVKGARVSSRYAGLPLKEGLVRILEDAGLSSYLLVYGDREQKTVRELFVMKGERTQGSTAPSAGRTPGRATSSSPETHGTRLSPPVPPMAPPPVTPPIPEELPESPPPLPPATENEDVPQASVPPPIPPGEMNEIPPPPPVLP